MSGTTGERSCYTLSTARDEVVRTDRNGGSIFRELPRILPPPLSPRLLSRKHHAAEFFRLRFADICEAFPMARTAPPRGTISRPPMQPGLFMQTEDVLWLPAAGICAELAVAAERDGLPNKCGKSPDTACACRERYGMRQSGLCDGFQEYDRQQPPRGLLPVMNPDPM